MNGPLFGGDTLYAESEVLDVDAAGDNPHADPRAQGGRRRGRAHHLPHGGRAGAMPAMIRRARSASRPTTSRTTVSLVEQVGLWFEDCVPGESFVHAPRRTLPS